MIPLRIIGLFIFIIRIRILIGEIKDKLMNTIEKYAIILVTIVVSLTTPLMMILGIFMILIAPFIIFVEIINNSCLYQF